MPLFSRPRSPAEIVRNLKEALNTLERGGDSKKQEKVGRTKSSSDLITFIVKYRRKSACSATEEDELDAAVADGGGKKKYFLQV